MVLSLCFHGPRRSQGPQLRKKDWESRYAAIGLERAEQAWSRQDDGTFLINKGFQSYLVKDNFL